MHLVPEIFSLSVIYLFSGFSFQNSELDRSRWLTVLKRSHTFDDPYIYLQYSQLLFDLKKYRKAAKILIKVISGVPEDYELIKKTANVCKIAGLLTEAEEYYRKVTYLQPVSVAN